ncbi:hypothetical protein TNCT_369071, partial [Trichonephila clavata]
KFIIFVGHIIVEYVSARISFGISLKQNILNHDF